MPVHQTQRDLIVWKLFLLTIPLSGLGALLNITEFIFVGLLHESGGYPFGGEGPSPWYYESQQLYTTVALISGLLFLLAFIFGLWAFFKVKKKQQYIALIITALLIVIEFINAQSG